MCYRQVPPTSPNGAPPSPGLHVRPAARVHGWAVLPPHRPPEGDTHAPPSEVPASVHAPSCSTGWGLLGARVDLVTRPALKPLIKPRIEAEAIRVA